MVAGHLGQLPEQACVGVAQAVRFVHNQHLPPDLLQRLALGIHHLVRRHQHVELVRRLGLQGCCRLGALASLGLQQRAIGCTVVKLRLGDDVTGHGIAVVQHDVHVAPRLHFPGPVGDGGQWAHDEKRPRRVVSVLQIPQEQHALRRLAQPHLVTQDAGTVALPVE